MGIIVANMFLTLDGVYQAPGGTEEDPENGFGYGGWQAPFFDDESGEAMGDVIDRIDALLLGRKTYDIFAGYWPKAGEDSPIAVKFNAVPKYVVSTTLTEPSWAGTTALPNAMAAAHLRERHDEVHLFGSGDLLQSLFTEDVVDRLNLWLYPLTLGGWEASVWLRYDSGVVPPRRTGPHLREGRGEPGLRARGRGRDRRYGRGRGGPERRRRLTRGRRLITEAAG